MRTWSSPTTGDLALAYGRTRRSSPTGCRIRPQAVASGSETQPCRDVGDWVDAAVTVPSRFQRSSAEMSGRFGRPLPFSLARDVCGAGTVAHRLCLLRWSFHRPQLNRTRPDSPERTNPTYPDPTGPADQKMGGHLLTAAIGRRQDPMTRHGHTARWHLILWSLADCTRSVSALALHAWPEMSRSICRILAPKLISISRQPMLIVANRCHLIQMLGSAVTCVNGCSCWSPDEENSPQGFPYHGCALPTELGGQVTALQLGTDIVAATPMRRPVNRVLTSIKRRRCYRIAAASTQPTPSSSAHPCAVHRPRSSYLTPPASRPDRAATQALQLGIRRPRSVLPPRSGQIRHPTTHGPLITTAVVMIRSRSSDIATQLCRHVAPG
jgi:hypothetical protein